MAHNPPVHVEPREEGWAVVREGNERATFVYRTQSEAAEAGRELARQVKTEFFLHARDGQVREHRSYEEGSFLAPSEDKGLVDQAKQTAGQEAERSTSASEEGSPDTEPDDAAQEEEHSLREARYDEDADTPEERYAGYEIHSHDGERLGKLDALFVDENDNPEYVGVRPPTSASTTSSIAIVPAEVIMVEDASRRMVVSCPKSLVEGAPRLGEGQQLEPGLEERVRAHYGLTSPPEGAAHYGAPYDAYYRSEAQQRAKARGPSEATPIPSGAEDVGRQTPEEDLEEVRVRRSEEELRTSTREHEAGAVRVRKRVRTDRERIAVPKKRVEVTVERVPVEGEATGSEIGDDEIVVPIVEEEVVVEKRPVVKEEIRIRKEVVEDTEIVEEEVKREEIDVDDQSNTR